MDIKTLIEADPRVTPIRQKYNYLVALKQKLIMDISHAEADIIKLSGEYEGIAKEYVEKYQPKQVVEVAPAVTPESEEDSIEESYGCNCGCEDPADPIPGGESEPEPSAETDRPAKEE